MEELATAPPPRHRPRRHRRKASDSATYGDVFGGGPRFAPPLAGVPGDYSDVFGGVAASCSIPYLDLPPAATGAGDAAGRYGEIFARFDFGEFAAPYEDVFVEAEEGIAEEIASWSGSSRYGFCLPFYDFRFSSSSPRCATVACTLFFGV